jgi:hypothetical protein
VALSNQVQCSWRQVLQRLLSNLDDRKGAMVTELKKTVSRKVHIRGKGDFVVSITKDGIAIRKHRKRKTVTLPFDQLALRAIEQAAYLLNQKEWDDPLGTLAKLSRLKRKN